MEKQGKIFILSGPSGSGKGTVLKSAMKNHPDMFLSVSATTRPPRTGEVDGVHYHFISDDAFLQMVERDELLEHAGYAGNFYGTPRIPVDEALAQGRDVMLEIDVQGAQQIYAKRPDAVRIFLAPPSWTELEHRLVGRGTDSAEKIQQRLRRARDEMALAADYDYFIINDDVERAAAERGIMMTDRTEVKHTTLIGSPLHLKRLLMNILSNAIKYNKDNGSIDLTCREVRSDGKIAWIEFICADTGIGMSEEFQKHLYEPFTQEHSDARTSYNGTGLGMAITKSLVEKMGGTIECRSKLGEGTTYCITIPFVIDSSAAPRVEETAVLPAATPAGMHVLLAEDNELNIEIAVFVLENAGVFKQDAAGQQAFVRFMNSVGFKAAD